MTAVLSWSGMAVMCSLYVTIPLISIFASEFGITTTQAAGAGSIFSLGFALGCLVYGALSDRYGRKQVITMGLIALTLISFLLGTAHNLTMLFVLRGLQGAAAATFSPVALAYAVEMFPAHKRVTTIGFISTGFLVAGILGQVISGIVSQEYGWNMVFYLLAAMYACTAVLIIWLLPKGKVARPQANIWEPIKQMRNVFIRKNLVFSYIAALVLLMSFVSMYSVLGSYLSGPVFRLNPHEILYVRSIGVLGMLVAPFAGRLARRYGVLAVLRGGLTLAVLGLSSLGMIPNLLLLVFMTLVFVSGIALAVPSLVSLIGQLGGEARGIAVSVYTFILFAGTSLGPIVSIQFMKLGSFSFTFILLALILSVGLLAACLVKVKSTLEAGGS
ncbi:MFS transporter [Paenibacillus zeisoli]|uniref:MFS transporter n=1 Tax=Paenibacillus zeisoli TaxID=2496267 RepID=A0A433X1H3_9BACL|nr:MFS transporter [Paenibacillus zeisoli]RUT27975.1 MFS transporter [Paenibacillus zeisoli]